MSNFLTKSCLPAVAAGLGIVLATAGAAMAQSTSLRPQDPSIGGQLNQCWGKVASQFAQLPTPAGTPGGALGQHSRSTRAADNVGGFAASGKPPLGPNITFNTLNADGNHGREGVGNVSAGRIHQTPTGDGGNGQHAINNANLTARIDPITGLFRPAGSAPLLSCDLVP